jgi:serine/threonine protein kinase
MMTTILRQTAWIRAAFGLYPHPMEQVVPFGEWPPDHERPWVGFRDRSFPEDQVRAVLDAFLKHDPSLMIVHQTRHRTTYRIEPGPDRKTTVFMKHYRCRPLSLLNPRNVLRLGHARKSFRLSYLLAETGIPIAGVLFYLHEKGGGVRRDFLLGTEGLTGSHSLRAWMRVRYPSLSRKEKEEFVKELARFIAMLHQSGVCHGDLESNTLVVAGKHPFFLIDLDSIRIFGPLLNRDRRKQLNTLERRLPEIGTNGEIRQLFLKTYEDHTRSGQLQMDRPGRGRGHALS